MKDNDFRIPTDDPNPVDNYSDHGETPDWQSADYTHTRSSGSVTFTPEEAMGRGDVIFDPDWQAFRQVTGTDQIGPDTIMVFNNGGLPIDLSLREAYDLGVVSQWDPAWGPEPVDPNALTPEELQDLQSYSSAPVNGSAELGGFESEDTPLEVSNLALEFDLQGVPRSQMEALADHLVEDENGGLTIMDEARDFLADRLGITDSADRVVSEIYNAWQDIAVKAIGPEAIDEITRAAAYNPEASADVKAIYKAALSGRLTKADLVELAERWGGR